MLLSESEGNLLIQIARDNIKSVLESGKKLDKNSYKQPFLQNNGAVFVTLEKHGELRGCIGSLEAYRPLIIDLLEHSYNAAFRDPRFNPVAKNELSDLSVEVSVLAPREKIEYSDFEDLKTKIVPNEDGIYLTEGFNSATFLPQVWEQLPDFESFFAHLCLKAGLSHDSMQTSKPKIERYKVQKFK